MVNNYSIFISYRRENGFETANLIYDRLTRAGYKVFLDCESLRSGKFNEQLYKQIENCKDFIVILPPDSLNRCENEGDWLRLEITHALKHKKNIVPVMLRNFTFPEELPDDIKELRNYQGIEASQELFNAFIEKLKSLLISKKHLTWQRTKKSVLFILIPLLIALGVLSYFQIQKNIDEEKEQAQLEQICSEVVAIGSLDFVKLNNTMIAIDDVYNEWLRFRKQIENAEQTKKQQLRTDLIKYIDFKMSELDTTVSEYNLSAIYEDILTKNKIKTEEIKLLFKVTESSEAKEYFEKMKMWANKPESGWLSTLDEGLGYLKELNLEMIRMNFYPFIQLVKSMPESARKSYLKVLPNLSMMPEVGFEKTDEELEALQNKSYEKCNQLMTKYASLIGNEARNIDYMEKAFEELAKNKKENDAPNQKKINELKSSVEKKQEIVNEKTKEAQEIREKILQSYGRMLEKCSFTSKEESSMMWGKILLLVKYAYNQISIEKANKDEYFRLRDEFKKKGLNPDEAVYSEPVVSVEEIFGEVNKRLNLYAEYNKARDKDAPKYCFAAKEYFKLVAKGKQDYTGVIVFCTENNLPHPVLKPGDIIIERKGQVIKNVDQYFQLTDNPSENIIKFIRFSGNGEMKIYSEMVPKSDVRVALCNLRND